MRRMITGKQVEFVNELSESAKLSMMEDYELHNILFPNDDMEIEEKVADFKEHTYKGTIFCAASALYPDYKGEDNEEAPSINLNVSMHIPEDINNDDDLLNWVYAHGLIDAQIEVDEYYFFKGEAGSLYYYDLLPGTAPYSGGSRRLDVTVTPQGLMTNWTLQNPVNPVDTLKLGAQLTEIQDGLGKTQLMVDENGVVVLKQGLPQAIKATVTNVLVSGQTLAFDLPATVTQYQHMYISAYLITNDGEYAVTEVFEPRLIRRNNNFERQWNSCVFARLDDSQPSGEVLHLARYSNGSWYLEIPSKTITADSSISEVYVW